MKLENLLKLFDDTTIKSKSPVDKQKLINNKIFDITKTKIKKRQNNG